MGGLTDRRPTLTTERLRLDPLTEGHLDHLVELDSDPEVLRFIWGRALTREESLRLGAKRIDPIGEARGIGAWAGFEQEVFVGWWTLQRDPDDDTTAELGYRLRRDAWGRGLATEGSRALLDHAFGTLALPRVWAGTMAVNTGSRGVMEKLGLRLERTVVRKWDEPLPGAELGEVYYAITREEWLRQRMVG